MTATGSPRDFTGWMKEVDRGLRQAKRAGAQANARIDEIVVPTPGNPAPSAPGPVPAAPVEITFQTSVFFDYNITMRWRGRIFVDFPPVTRSTEAEAITVRGYELQGYRPSALPTESAPPLWESFGHSPQPGFQYDNLIPGETYVMRVRADNGLWSETFTATIVADTVPPPQPTAPEVLALPGAIRVLWDKLAVNGSMPQDFAYISVAAGLDPSPEEEVAQLDAVQPMYLHTGVGYYTPVFFRFQAVDYAGNRSPWSEQATAFLKPLVNEDVIITRLDAAETEIVNAEKMLFDAQQTLGDKLDFHRNKITANQLLIGRGENFIPWFANHPDPELRTLAPHTLPEGAVPNFEGVGGRSNGPHFFVRHDGVVSGTMTEVLRFRPDPESNLFPVEPNTMYKFSVWVKAGGAYPSGMPQLDLQIQTYDSAGVYETGSAAQSTAKALTWDWQEVTFEYRTNAASAGLRLLLRSNQPGVVRIEHPLMVKDGSSLIATGGITTNMLYVTQEMVAKLLSVRKVKAGEIETNNLAADTGFIGALKTHLVTADLFSGKSFNGGTFTGSTFRTQVSPAASGGIQIDTVGIRAWNTTGGTTFILNASNGNVSIGGGTFTGGLFQSVSTANRGIKLSTAGLHAYNSSGKATFILDAVEGDAQFDSRVRFGLKTSPSWVVVPWESTTQERAGVWLVNSNSSGIGGEETAGMFMDNSNATFANPMKIRGMNGGGLQVFGRLQSADMYSGTIQNADGRYKFQGANGSYFMGSLEMHGNLFLSAPATTAAANAHIASANGMVYRSSSASRYKVDSRPMELDDALLDVPVEHWIDRGQLEQRAALAAEPQPHTEDTAKMLTLITLDRIPGAIAEKVEAAGGRDFVSYGRDGQIEGLAYDRFALARTAILKRQLDAAIARIEVLEGLAA